MREQLRDRNRLEHILDAINTIQQRAQGLTLEQLEDDKMLYGGIVYYTMIIGEAAYMLSKEFKETHPATPWRQIEGMRHHIVHGYYQVRKDMLLMVVKNDLHTLKHQIQSYLSETSSLE